MKISILAVLLVLVACASLDNQVYTSTYKLYGGVKGEKSWRSALPFERYSWYSRTTMYLDLYVGEITQESPFSAWLSSQEKKEAFLQCSKVFLLLAYHFQTDKLEVLSIYNAFEKKGLKPIELKSFFHELANHSSYRRHHLEQYEQRAYCADSSKASLESIELDLASFPLQNISLSHQ